MLVSVSRRDSGKVLKMSYLFRFEIYFTLLSYVFIYCEGLKEELNYYETLTLSDLNRRVRRSAGVRPESAIHEVQFSALGRDFHMLLKQEAPVSYDFKAHMVDSKGHKNKIEVDFTQFLSGRLKDEKESKVDVHWEEGLMIASIIAQDDIYFIEPSWRYLDSNDNQSMIAYRKSDLKWYPTLYTDGVRSSFCGTNNTGRLDLPEKDLDDGIKLYPVRDDTYGHSRQKRQSMSMVGSHTACRLIVVGDKYFYDNIGRGSKKLSGDYLIGMIARVNSIYKRTRWPSDSSGLMNLGFEIAELIVHSDYTEGTENYNMAKRTNDMGKVLDMFGWEWQKFKTFCLAHLFTYQSFPGKLGLAYIASWRYTDLGGMCSPVAWKGGRRMAANTGVSTYQNPGGSRAPTLQATITTAHGHNWGSEHDPDTSECAPGSSSGGRYIMYPSAVSGYQANNDEFSPCSRRYIYKVISKKGYNCFKEPSEPSGSRGLCGNGRLDKGEQCDAGYEGDKCCDEECRLKNPAYKCSPMNYACCEDCRIAPSGKQCIEDVNDNLDCTESSSCNGSSLHCPKPKNALDNTDCYDGGKCFGGICKDYCAIRNREPCLCAGKDACKRCCKFKNTEQDTYPCLVIDDTEFHQDGRPCGDGFCEKGICKAASGTLVKRLYNIIEYFSIDNIAIIMKNNIVWLVFFLAMPVWILAMCLIDRQDRKNEKMSEYKPERLLRTE